jgi:hypothetical protein
MDLLEIGEYIVSEAKKDALAEMKLLLGNEGQEAIYNEYIAPVFDGLPNDPYECFPSDVWASIPYPEAVGEIVEVGITIVENAVQTARDVQLAIELFDLIG